MSSIGVQPLSDIVDVIVQVTGIAATAPSFNTGLIVGPTAAAGYSGSRILQFNQGNWSSAMIAAGFLTSSIEYNQASAYFSQEVPAQTLMVGLINPSSLNTVTVQSPPSGANYTQGDVVAVSQGSPPNLTGLVEILTVSAGGVPTSLGVIASSDGTGYTVGTNLPTMNVTVANPLAAGLEVNVSSVGETPLNAITYLRSLNGTWYGCACASATDSDHEAIAGFVQGVTPPAKYYWGSSASAIPASPYNSASIGDVAAYMEANSYSRSVGVYSTTQSGAAPNNLYVGAAVMGVEMGLNTGLAGSYYTLMFKTVVGITPEPLTDTQVANVQSKNCNLISNFANAYAFIWKGVTGRIGWFSDLVTFLDIFTAGLQYDVMNALVALAAVPMDNAGEQMLIHAVNGAADNLVAIGAIQPGVWEGVTIQLTPNVGITPGTALTNGYLTFAAPFSTQSAGAAAARQGMPIYVCCLFTGAIQGIVIYVDAQA